MDQKFFAQPFAFAGDKTAIPDAVQPSGSVSFNQGYGFDYQRELGADPDAKAVERGTMNWLFGAITENLAQYQRSSIPEFVTAADNGGAPFPYARGVMVRWRASGADPFLTYISRVPNNTDDPSVAASWSPFVFEEASNAQAIAGTSHNVWMSPANVALAIANSTVSIPPASTSVAGITRYSTDAEAIAGTVTDAAVTPAALAAAVPAASTTAVGKMRLATTAEVNALSLNGVAVSPASMAAIMGTKANLSGAAFTGKISVVGTITAPTTGSDYAVTLSGQNGGGLRFLDVNCQWGFTTNGTTMEIRSAGPAPAAINTVIQFTGPGAIIANGGFQQGSSIKLKHDMRRLRYGLDEVLRIKTYVGKYKPEFSADQRDRLFLHAENLVEVIPEAVDREGVEFNGERAAVADYPALVPVLVNAIRELNADRLALAAQVAALAERIEKLEG